MQVRSAKANITDTDKGTSVHFVVRKLFVLELFWDAALRVPPCFGQKAMKKNECRHI